MQSQNQHPASPYVVYGNIGPPPEPNSTEEMYARELKLQISAKRQAITIIEYENKKKLLPKDEDYLIEIPCIRTSPPIICSNGVYYRFSKEEWNHAVNQAKEKYILELLEENN